MAENTELNRRSDEQLLEESFEDLYENAPCGYVSTLPNGTFVKVNRTFLNWTGYQREELLSGKRLQDLLTVGGKIFYETHYAPLLQMRGSVNEIAFELVCQDGHQLPILINSVQKLDASGAPLLNRTTIFNSSDRREYERELQLARKKAEQALQLRDLFLSLASHELKTPLTVLLGNVQILQRRVSREKSLGTRDQQTLQLIADQTNRLTKLVAALLDISRIEAGQLSIERVPINVCALVSRVVDEVQSTHDQRLIELKCSIQAMMIQGDELRLEQVFQNLIQNALKYSAPYTPIVVAVRQHEAHVYIEVHDRGIGIPQTSLPQLFERFYRATNVQDKSISGMGIGLYVVKEIVGLHGGQVMVESIEGHGTTFTVSLPLEETHVH